MNDQNDEKSSKNMEGPTKRAGPREHPITILVDSEVYDLIEDGRTGRTSSGKILKEPKSTFLYDIIKVGLAGCVRCGGPLSKLCQDCDG